MPRIQFIDAMTENDLRGVEPQDWSDVPRIGENVVLVLAKQLTHVKVIGVSWVKAETLTVRLVVERIS